MQEPEATAARLPTNYRLTDFFHQHTATQELMTCISQSLKPFQIRTGFIHFPTIAPLKKASRNAKSCKSLDDLHREFRCRFSDFEKMACHFSWRPCTLSQNSETSLQELHLEVINLQSNSVVKAKSMIWNMFAEKIWTRDKLLQNLR